MRDRLIDILNAELKTHFDYVPLGSVVDIADKLLSSGVFVLPCKVGTELYLSTYPNGHHRLKEYRFCGDRIVMVIDCWEWQRTCTRWVDEFGKTVFLTKEEAETALRKEEEGK